MVQRLQLGHYVNDAPLTSNKVQVCKYTQHRPRLTAAEASVAAPEGHRRASKPHYTLSTLREAIASTLCCPPSPDQTACAPPRTALHERNSQSTMRQRRPRSVKDLRIGLISRSGSKSRNILQVMQLILLRHKSLRIIIIGSQLRVSVISASSVLLHHLVSLNTGGTTITTSDLTSNKGSSTHLCDASRLRFSPAWRSHSSFRLSTLLSHSSTPFDGSILELPINPSAGWYHCYQLD